MIDKFPEFRDLMEKHWKEITKDNPPIFEVDINKSAFYQLYLDSFPEGANPVYRQRREFDCSCCHHFINQVGSVLVYTPNGWSSVWDFDAPYPFTDVCKVMSAELHQHSLRDIFYIDSKHAGTKYSTEYKGIEVIRWDHFFLDVPETYVRSRVDIPGLKGDFLDSKNVFYRTMQEITLDAMEIVYDLICSNSLYRGEEWKTQIAKLIELKHIYDNPATDRNAFIWTTPTKIPASLARIRNSSIGTLLISLSEGMEVENAVRAYEQVVAPANYKRSKPVFTKRMLEQAQKDITNLGYLDSLGRRYATLDDIKITNVLFANRDARAAMNAPVNPFEALASKAVSKPKNFDNLREVKIEDFIKDILPTCTSVEVYLDNKLTSNLCSLIAPVNANSKCMFKWNNNFSWAYTGNITDSQIRENVKMAGGRVDGVLRFSIQWNDQDYNPCDYDAHCEEENGRHIYFGAKRSYASNGELDIDIIDPVKGKPAVENIIYPSLNKMPDGEYRFFVHCYSQHGNSHTGFRAEIEMNGKTYQYDYSHYLKNSEQVNVAIVEKKNDQLILKQEFIPSATSSRKVWNLTTNEFVPVSLVCCSPNYWEEPGIGNKHYFFMLKNCVSDESPNGFYNEFLNQELNKNRKVLEALGAQMAVQPIDNPLCGLGFSSTKRNSLVVKVDSQFMKIVF